MNINSKTYMRNREFKERQSSFEFFCAAAVDFLSAFRAECRKGWQKLFKRVTEQFENITLPLPFDRPITHREWQRLAMQTCFNMKTA